MYVPITDLLHSPHVKLQPLSITNVQLADSFFAPRLEKNRTITLPTQYHLLETTGRLRNFQWAAGDEEGSFEGLVFNDSDVYKWLEAASFSLATHPDPSLEALVDHVITLIARAQQPDGYLNTYFTHDRQHLRWTNLAQQHEHYCAGHLIQAAIAHHRATGKSTLLLIAQRLADLICQTFGPHRRAGVDGHEEIEMALIELYRETHLQRYLNTALFFLNERGQDPPRLGHREYLQDHLPVREQSEAIGHAVRLTYLACGMTDAAAETGDITLLKAADRLWQSAFYEKAYLTGGLGARYEGEAFGAPYELPQERAYAETCAAIGAMMWSWRMLQQYPEARFADILERLLYNGFLSGISLSGDAYFYVNPLADRGHHRRQPWFTCACCPPNIARILASLPGYFASTTHTALWIHLYARGILQAPLPNGQEFTLSIDTNYPWNGSIRLTILSAPAYPATLSLRIPGWSRAARLTYPEQAIPHSPSPGTYAHIHRRWSTGDLVELNLPMPIERMVSHPHVIANIGQVALTRGPLVYCFETADNPDIDPWDCILPDNVTITAHTEPELLGGITTLHAPAFVRSSTPGQAALYAPLHTFTTSEQPRELIAIPYYTWANRHAGPMRVWLPRA